MEEDNANVVLPASPFERASRIPDDAVERNLGFDDMPAELDDPVPGNPDFLRRRHVGDAPLVVPRKKAFNQRHATKNRPLEETPSPCSTVPDLSG